MRAAGAVAALVLAGGAALAQEAEGLAPESAPAPEARPEGAPADTPRLIPPEEMKADPPASEQPGEAEAVERPSAEDNGEEPTGERAGADEEPSEAAGDEPLHAPTEGPPVRETLAESEADLAACLVELDALGTAYERVEPIAEEDQPDCGIVNPVEVIALLPGIELSSPVTLRCETALAAARWVADVALPASRKLDDRGPLAGIDVGTSYLCRPRADGELSEHAFGNAIDVIGFRFESGAPIAVEPREGDGTLAESFQDVTRFGACLDFSTVLGPGSDEDHADHIHLDVRDRRGGFRICD